MTQSMAIRIYTHALKNKKTFQIKELYDLFPDNAKETVRARVYTHLGVLFEKVSRGVYVVKSSRGESSALLINGNGRDLSMIEDESIDAIVTDHPWSNEKAHKGTNKTMRRYSDFHYTLEDFLEKYRVLKKGSFLVENLPQESESNFEYLYKIKKMAQRAGFKFWCMTIWTKGKLIHNTGRVAKNKEFLYFFTKGNARKLRPNKNTRQSDFMSGTSSIVPAQFNFQPPSPKKKVHPSEKPIELLKEIIRLITKEGELVLDQFAGSANIIEACLETNRNCIAIELDEKYVRNKYIELKEVI
ncbi:MAG: site-specific DNA-methyltransferase [Oligoflexia bacterium]|nr:site-specific DNA-methyltransferase [Oligoflexia bacterium]